MYPFPPRETLSFLKGLELVQVTLNPYSIDFVFDGHPAGARVVAEHSFEYVESDGKTHVYDIQHEWAPVVLHPLIRGDKIEIVDVSEWRLSLTFASGRKLIVLSQDGRYESGQIYGNDQLIVF